MKFKQTDVPKTDLERKQRYELIKEVRKGSKEDSEREYQLAFKKIESKLSSNVDRDLLDVLAQLLKIVTVNNTVTTKALADIGVVPVSNDDD